MGIGKINIKKKPKRKDFSESIEISNSLFIIIGNSVFSENRSTSLPGVIQDIAKLKRILLSEAIGFDEANILTLLNAGKDEVVALLKNKVESRDWVNIVFYYSGFGARNDDGVFFISCFDSDFANVETYISGEEIGLIFKESASNIILLFDCCHAQSVFRYLYNKDVFLLGAANESGFARDTSEGGLFTKSFIEVLNNGIDNGKEFLSLNDIYLELRKKLLSVQEPEMLTTNIVQHQIFAKNKIQAEEIAKVDSVMVESKDQILELVKSNRLVESFEQLSVLIRDSGEDLKNKVMLFENRFSRLSDEMLLGLISKEKSNIENNQIVYGLLNIVNEI